MERIIEPDSKGL